MLFSTEMVSKYHPDKAADQISDAVLTECLKQDRNSHVACECLFKGTTVVLAGEINSNAKVDYEAVAKRVASKLGYQVTEFINRITTQSPEINNAVVSDKDIGAGDQGMMFGYAVKGGKYFLEPAQELAIDVIKAVEEDIEKNPSSIFKGDAKTQITTDDGKLDTVLLSVCHKEGLTIEEVRSYVKNILCGKVISTKEYQNARILINPSGLWTLGGPAADCGLTGRKIVCDQYGGYAPVGGGAFSGKDPSKVDRSGCYIARKIAVDLVKKFDCNRAEVQLAYAIGVSQPVSVCAKCDGKDYSKYVKDNYNLSPKAIIDYLGLLDGIDYEKIAEGNHMIMFV